MNPPLLASILSECYLWVVPVCDPGHDDPLDVLHDLCPVLRLLGCMRRNQLLQVARAHLNQK